MSSRASLIRAIAFGLSAGLVFGGLGLLGYVARRKIEGVDCAALSPSECALEESVVRELSRLQTLTGVFLAVMGLALFVYSRKSEEGMKP